MKKTTQQRACVGLIFVAALLIKIPLANAQQQSFIFPQVADGIFDGGYYKTTLIILPANKSSTSVVTGGFVLYGLGVDLDGSSCDRSRIRGRPSERPRMSSRSRIAASGKRFSIEL
jgi:hypothetical protein